MARSVNQVTLMGNLTRDPEVRQVAGGQSVCRFSLALNRSRKDQASGEWIESTDYVDVVAWGPMGENVAKYLAKGRKCLVTGSLRSSSWEQDGAKRSKLEVNATDVVFMDGRGEGGDDGGQNDRGGYEGGQSNGGGSSSRGASNDSKQKDTVIEDIGDEPINLDDIPF